MRVGTKRTLEFHFRPSAGAPDRPVPRPDLQLAVAARHPIPLRLLPAPQPKLVTLVLQVLYRVLTRFLLVATSRWSRRYRGQRLLS